MPKNSFSNPLLNPLHLPLPRQTNYQHFNQILHIMKHDRNLAASDCQPDQHWAGRRSKTCIFYHPSWSYLKLYRHCTGTILLYGSHHTLLKQSRLHQSILLLQPKPVCQKRYMQDKVGTQATSFQHVALLQALDIAQSYHELSLTRAVVGQQLQANHSKDSYFHSLILVQTHLRPLRIVQPRGQILQEDASLCQRYKQQQIYPLLQLVLHVCRGT